jgi:hypothetical protein
MASTSLGVSAGRFTLFRVAIFRISAVQEPFAAGSIPGSSTDQKRLPRNPL